MYQVCQGWCDDKAYHHIDNGNDNTSNVAIQSNLTEYGNQIIAEEKNNLRNKTRSNVQT